MNVLFLALDVDLLVPRGDAIHVREQVKFLAERGHRIDLVTATHDGMSGLGSNVHSHTAIGTDLVVVRKCRAIVRAVQAAVVYERRLSPKIAFAVSRLSHIPFVVEVNGVEEEAAMQGRPSTSPLRPLKFRVRKRMYRAAARVVAVTDRLATHTWQLYGLPSEKVVTIPNGVDLATFAPIDAAQARRDLGLAGANWVVFVGNLVGWQGVDVLLRAAPRVVREQSDARYRTSDLLAPCSTNSCPSISAPPRFASRRSRAVETKASGCRPSKCTNISLLGVLWLPQRFRESTTCLSAQELGASWSRTIRRRSRRHWRASWRALQNAQ